MKITEIRKNISEIKESLQWILTDLQQNKGTNYDGDKQLVDNALSMAETLENKESWEAEVNNNPDFYWKEWKDDLKTKLAQIEIIAPEYEDRFGNFCGELDAVVDIENTNK